MIAKWGAIGACVLAFAFVLSSCEQVFTFSPLKAFQRNPSQMSAAQKVTYAQDALASGDPATMKEAYNAISADATNNPKDGSLNLLAGQLAFGASGATSALTQALADVASGASLSTLQTVANSVDINLVTDGAKNIVNADNAGQPVTDSQYAIASAALVVAAAQQAGGYQQLTTSNYSGPGSTDLQQAKDLASKITSSPELTSALQQFGA